MRVLVDGEELKKIEQKLGPLKQAGREKLKWLLPPEWSEKQFEGVVVEVPDSKAPEIFKNFRVKALRRDGRA